MYSSVEKKLLKENDLELYNEELRKVIEKGHLSKMSKEELETYNGPISYVSHHPVYKDSKTTPVRLATNSSLKNKTCGFSPNECMGSPPNALSSLLKVFLRWRTYRVALNVDLTKAYQSIKTPGDLERNVRRLVWRWGMKDAVWEIYCWEVMTFGDQLAALILELAKNMAATLGQTTDPEAVDLLENSTYVDDICGGGSQEQVDRFKGYKNEDGTYSGTLPTILSNVGLKTKVMVQSHETDEDALDKFGNRVLGHLWDPVEDKLIFKFTVNLSSKNRKGECLEPDLQKEDIPSLPNQVLTKHRLLGFVMSLYDPTGLLSPITIKLKIELRRLFSKESSDLGWDDPIPSENHENWVRLLGEQLSQNDVTIDRSVNPVDAIGRPELFAFFDGSLDAYASCVYVRWRLGGNHPKYSVSLLAAKARVTSVRGSTAPRSELSGLLITSRLLLTVVPSMSMKPSKVTISGDSQCTIAAMERSGERLAPYFCNRVSEISRNLGDLRKETEVEQIFHIPGPVNPADLPTRETATFKDLSQTSTWISGPTFLHLENDAMPMSRCFMSQNLEVIPPAELRPQKVSLLATEFSSDSRLSLFATTIMERTNNLDKAVNVLARITKAHITHDKSKIADPLSPGAIDIAYKILFAASMGPTRSNYQKGKLASLKIFSLGSILYMEGRVGRALEHLLGSSRLPVLMPETTLAKLIMWQAHNEDHRRSSADTLARSRERAWIVRGGGIARKVSSACPKCRLESEKTQTADHGEYPRTPADTMSTFHKCQLRLHGPLLSPRSCKPTSSHQGVWTSVCLSKHTSCQTFTSSGV